MAAMNVEGRIQWIEDMEAIKKLKFDYAEGCDKVCLEKNLGPLLETFTEDVVWDGGDFGRHIGKEQIRKFLIGIQEMLIFSVHYFMNPRIVIDGDQGTGHWYLLALFTDVNGQDLVLVGIEDDKYKKIDGQWLISEMKLTTHFQSPLAEGWHKITMAKFK